MTDINQAIGLISNLIRNGSLNPLGIKALSLAIVALHKIGQEEEDSYSQCEECGQFYGDCKGYDYCPNCGRKLEVEE